MKNITYLIAILTLALTSCSGEESIDDKKAWSIETEKKDTDVKEENEDFKVDEMDTTKYAITWKGKLGKNIPVFMHYTIMDSVLSGELTYLNTKKKQPIRILGTILPNNFYHILEFDDKALITGIWSLTHGDNVLTGSWFRPDSRGDNSRKNEFDVNMTTSDSLVKAWDLSPQPQKVFGEYEYNYTKENGNVGSLWLKKKNEKEALFEVLGVHSAPGFNIASIEETVIPFTNNTKSFDFLIPEVESCDFKVSLFNDFISVKYIRGYCTGYFGHNAGVEGLYLKTK